MQKVFLLFFLFSALVFAQHIKVIESTDEYIILEYSALGSYSISDTTLDGKQFEYVEGIDVPANPIGTPNMPLERFLVGVPHNSKPVLEILSKEIATKQGGVCLPVFPADSTFREVLPEYFADSVYYRNDYFPRNIASAEEMFSMRYAKVLPLHIHPVRYNPISRQYEVVQKLRIKISYGTNVNISSMVKTVDDPMSKEFVKNNCINADIAERWIAKKQITEGMVSDDDDWYVSGRRYYKMYLSEKGVYKVTFEELVKAGVPLDQGVSSVRLEMYANEKVIPIEVIDGDDDLFGAGDYIRFVGYPAPPTRYAKQNIYNTSNVYWMTIDAEDGLRYTYADGYPYSWDETYQQHKRIDHYEEDVMFERLGYAPDGKRDYWFWGRVSGMGGSPSNKFVARFETFPQFDVPDRNVTFRVNMHGMTNFFCQYGHAARIYINDVHIGTALWDGQTEFTYDTTFNVDDGVVKIYPEGNEIRIETDGNICHSSKSDEFRVNWFEFEYWSNNRISDDEIVFSSPAGASGVVKYWLWQWEAQTCKVFIPEKQLLLNEVLIANDEAKTMMFIDTVSSVTDYFLVADNTPLLTVSSIEQDKSSQLKGGRNEADYIIIYHPDLTNSAMRLASLRVQDFPDTSISSPRVFLANIVNIYDEFSGGLLDPYAVKSFIKHAYDNFEGRTPSYVVLVGDMSYDYRMIEEKSRPNFIPAIPYHAVTYGQAASDHEFVTVSGDDEIPDLAIGRISVETEEEGAAFLDKLEHYPDAQSKKWRETVLLLASGLSSEDESKFGFNDASNALSQNYIERYGYDSERVYRYPTRTEHFPYEGSTPEIRAAFDKGTVFANYYGHGGGYQWDLTFLNDDIYLLNNYGMLPLIISVTCYTAHYDNQNVFGEQFIKVPEKGAVGFFGSSGLTFWNVGKYYNNLLFTEIFKKKNYVSGKFFMDAKANSPGGEYFDNQLSLLAYLGDPVFKLALPDTYDFAIKKTDISISPENPLVGETVTIKVYPENLGIIAEQDTNLVTVQISTIFNDTTKVIDEKAFPVFANKDSMQFVWEPENGGEYILQVSINGDQVSAENDYSDNIANKTLTAFNLSEPAVLEPKNGFTTNESSITFHFVDKGHYLGKELLYHIQIDTSITFDNPIIEATELQAEDGYLFWNTPALTDGCYFWRGRIFDGENYGRWSSIKSFQITDIGLDGFSLANKQLQLFEMTNVRYDETQQSLVQIKEMKPPKPSPSKFVEDISLNATISDTVKPSCIATDGKYLYVAHLWYWVQQDPNRSHGKTAIYKYGTGNQGTIAGEYYGKVPNFYGQVRDQFTAHSDGYLYIPDNNAKTILKLHPETGASEVINIPTGLINNSSGTVTNGSFYLASDGEYIYNLATLDAQGEKRYSLRIFDPENGWEIVEDYDYTHLVSYDGFTNFFVANGYYYPYENFHSGFMRAVRITDGYYREEWTTWNTTQETKFTNFYGWTYDYVNDVVYGSIFKPGLALPPLVSKFIGTHYDALGIATTPEVGPVSKWKELSYDIENISSTASHKILLMGKNEYTGKYDTLIINPSNHINLQYIDSKRYRYLKVKVEMTDSSRSEDAAIFLKEVRLDYEELPELILTKNDISFEPDSLLQGFDITTHLRVNNIGKTDAEEVKLMLYLDESDTPFYTDSASIQKESFVEFNAKLNTSSIVFKHEITATLTSESSEYFTFNNMISKNFYVSRDSVKPEFSITFDGQEIINGDIISSTPVIDIQLKDNSPLPMDTTGFTIIVDNKPVIYANSDVTFSYQEYPEATAEIRLEPTFREGRHTIDILARDASNNFFDSTFHRSLFYVYETNDFVELYNYPNPFTNDTHFFFELRGQEVPESITIKIFTIAGRVIRDIEILPHQYDIGFNTYYWDGKDQDGDEIANGVYLYNANAKYNDRTISITNKIAKVR